MNIINLTQHDIVIALPDNTRIAIPPTAPAARMATKTVSLPPVDEIPVNTTVFGEVQNLPDPQPDTVYVVSTLIAQRVKRPDVVSPDTGTTAIRNSANQIEAVRALQSFA